MSSISPYDIIKEAVRFIVSTKVIYKGIGYNSVIIPEPDKIDDKNLIASIALTNEINQERIFFYSIWMNVDGSITTSCFEPKYISTTGSRPKSSDFKQVSIYTPFIILLDFIKRFSPIHKDKAKNHYDTISAISLSFPICNN